MADTRVPIRCDGCGQTDDHPKHHYAAQVFHHDCTPAYVIDDMTHESIYSVENGQIVLQQRIPLPEEEMHPGTRRFLAIREKANKGTRGVKLAEWIADTDTSEEN